MKGWGQAVSRPFASVVIDNHNYGRYLRQAIESVLSQDVPKRDFELVVVDDGSTDDSRDILASYGSRLRAVLQPQQGQATAFNRGFSEARGEVVCLLDSDDVWKPGKLAAVLPLFDDPKVGAAQHWLEDADAALDSLPQSFPRWPARYTLEDFLRGETHFTATSGLAYRRDLLQRALPIPPELFYYLDDFLTVRVLFEAELANIPKVLGAHRVHGGNWCAGGYEDARKLETDFRMRGIFGAHLKRWLSEDGKSLSPRYLELQDLEVFRRRVLYEALSARPVEAYLAWWEGFKRWRRSPFGRFKTLTAFLAVCSPTLYLSLYSAYAGAKRLKDMRLRLFPEDSQ